MGGLTPLSSEVHPAMREVLSNRMCHNCLYDFSGHDIGAKCPECGEPEISQTERASAQAALRSWKGVLVGVYPLHLSREMWRLSLLPEYRRTACLTILRLAVIVCVFCAVAIPITHLWSFIKPAHGTEWTEERTWWYVLEHDLSSSKQVDIHIHNSGLRPNIVGADGEHVILFYMSGASRDKVQRLSLDILFDAIKSAPMWVTGGGSPQLLWFIQHYWALPALLGTIGFLLLMSTSCRLGPRKTIRMMSIMAGSFMPFIVTLFLFVIVKVAFIGCQIEITVLEVIVWCNLGAMYLPIYSLIQFTLTAPCSLGRRLVVTTGLILVTIWMTLPIAVGESPLMGESHGYQWL